MPRREAGINRTLGGESQLRLQGCFRWFQNNSPPSAWNHHRCRRCHRYYRLAFIYFGLKSRATKYSHFTRGSALHKRGIYMQWCVQTRSLGSTTSPDVLREPRRFVQAQRQTRTHRPSSTTGPEALLEPDDGPGSVDQTWWQARKRRPNLTMGLKESSELNDRPKCVTQARWRARKRSSRLELDDELESIIGASDESRSIARARRRGLKASSEPDNEFPKPK